MPAKVIQDFWIITEGGIVVYDRVYDEAVDPQLFGALMSAVNHFAEEIANSGLSNLELSARRFTIKKRENALFIATSDKKLKPKKVMQELDGIMDKFFIIYSKDLLDNWDGDISMFENFNEEIEESLDSPVDKMKKAFW